LGHSQALTTGAVEAMITYYLVRSNVYNFIDECGGYMNKLRRIIGTILVVLLLAAMAGCSGSDSVNNDADKSGSLTGSGK